MLPVTVIYNSSTIADPELATCDVGPCVTTNHAHSDSRLLPRK